MERVALASGAWAPEEAAVASPEAAAQVLRRLREASRRWARRERPCLPSGVPALDRLLAGGWPLGRVAELVGAATAGGTAVAAATVAAATGRGEVVAWVDTADALDPPSLAAAGVELERVLWVRPRGVEAAVRAAELVLEAGGFTVVVVDVAGRGQGAGPRGQEEASDGRAGTRQGGRRGALALRLARAAERARAAVLVRAGRSWVGAHAAVTVVLGCPTACWEGGQGRSPRWLHGLELLPSVARGSGLPTPGSPSAGPEAPAARLSAAPALQLPGPGARPLCPRPPAPWKR